MVLVGSPLRALAPALELCAGSALSPHERQQTRPPHRKEHEDPAGLAQREKHAQTPRRGIGERGNQSPDEARQERRAESHEERREYEQGDCDSRHGTRPCTLVAEIVSAIGGAGSEDDAAYPLERGQVRD